MSRHLLIIIICAAATLIVAAAGLWWLGHDRNSRPPPETALSPPATTSPNGPAGQTSPPGLETMIAGLRQDIAAGATGEPVEVTLTITEAAANSEVAPRLLAMELPADLPLEPESLHINFQPDTVLTEVTGTAHGMPVTAEIAARVNIVEGKPEIAVTDIELGWLPLPRSVKGRLAVLITDRVAELQNEAIDREMAAIIGGADWSVTSLNIQEEQVTVTLLIVPETGD